MLLKNTRSKLLEEFGEVKRAKNQPITADIEAVVVLSGESGDPISENGSFDTQQRLATGIKIYKKIVKIGGQPTLFISGTRPQNKLMKKIALDKNIERVIILEVPPSPYASTLDQFKSLARLNNIHLLIVTHAWHGPRTLRYALGYLPKEIDFNLYLIYRREMSTAAVNQEIKKLERYSKKGDIELFLNKQKVVAIIQARMSSTRLPGKVLKAIAGKPMLWHVVNRTRKAKSLDKVIVATSTDKSDDVIVNFCKKEKIEYFRGSLDDVLSRYLHAAKREKTDIVVRVTSDCPLIDGELIDKGIKKLLNGNFDYCSNTVDRTYPRGFDFEIIKFSALEKAFNNASKKPEREHVTPYIWRNHPNNFKIKHFKQKENKSDFRITVDTPEDLEVIEILIEKYQADKKGYQEIIKLLEDHPEIVVINKNVEQKHYGQ